MGRARVRVRVGVGVRLRVSVGVCGRINAMVNMVHLFVLLPG